MTSAPFGNDILAVRIFSWTAALLPYRKHSYYKLSKYGSLLCDIGHDASEFVVAYDDSAFDGNRRLLSSDRLRRDFLIVGLRKRDGILLAPVAIEGFDEGEISSIRSQVGLVASEFSSLFLEFYGRKALTRRRLAYCAED